MTGVVAETGVRTAGAVVARLTRWIGIASMVLSAIILAAELDERFTLPECGSARAAASLLELARAAQIEGEGVQDQQSLPSASDEISCKASLAVSAGAAIGVRYRFYWDGWTQKVELTGVEE